MQSLDFLQAILGLIALGGIGGVWVRIGRLIEKSIAQDQRHDGHDERFSAHGERILHLERRAHEGR